MAKGLLWKEWRQLRALRLTGIVLAVLLPLAIWIGAEASVRGLSLKRMTGYTTQELFLDALPAALALGLWPLIALLVAAQTFAGDRASGTEIFLLERPVPRGRIWRARLFASAGSILMVAGISAALALTFAHLGVHPTSGAWSRPIGFMTAGLAVTAAVYLGGVAAASVIGSPVASILGGLLLAAIPVGLAAVLGEWFSLVRVAGVPLGFLLPLALFLSYPIASWLAACRGEPAGRGRIKRTVVFTAAAVLLVPIVYAAAAPVLLRRQTSAEFLDVDAAGLGGGAVVRGGGWMGGAWILDVDTGERLRFLPPPVHHAVWSPDGQTLAVVTFAGPLGSLDEKERVEIYDRRGLLVRPPLVLDAETVVTDARWADDALLLSRVQPGGNLVDVVLLSTETGAMRQVATGLDYQSVFALGPTEDGSVFLMKASERPGGRPGTASDAAQRKARLGGNTALWRDNARFELRKVELTPARLGPALLEDFSPSLRGEERLSPSGRWWLGQSPDRHYRVTEIASGRDHALGHGPIKGVEWLAGDRLVWVEIDGRERTLCTALPGEAPHELRRLRGDAGTGYSVRLRPSPDRRKLLVQAHRKPPDGTWRIDELLVYSFPGGSAIELGRGPVADAGSDPDRISAGWAGPDTIAWSAPGMLALEDLDGPGRYRFLIGSGSD